MKILHVITTMNPKSGGPAQGIRNLNPYLQNSGHTVEVVTMDQPNANFETEDNFVIHKVGKGITAFQYNKKFYDWLVSNLANYDYVITHGLWQYHNWATYKAIKTLEQQKTNTPKVAIMPHGMLDPYFQQAKDRRWKAFRNKIVWHFTERTVINNADALFFTCKEELKLAKQTFKGYNPKKAINVGFGIKPPPVYTIEMQDAFESITPKELQGKKYWLFLSRIHSKKGIKELIEAYTKVSKTIPTLPNLVVAGPTDCEYAQEMIALAGGNPKIHFVGMLSGLQKWGAFYGCQVYLLPSYQENFGISIVEAMACKKPVLITKKVNIWNEIDSSNACWLLDNVSVFGITKKIFQMEKLQNEDFENKGQNAYQAYCEYFKIKKYAKKIVKTLGII